ncbi:uncharacterized protein L203_104727 [Cryptococcus depauperatus CBS 7841]|uniref:GDP-Man:Man(3)GlcNAc(2)-PP-Dol alpha-1,2-mannosyltransferase n=1 Tax=Cryptococcus depauperatus CBS 7841 TaxID=1295531 RepID=A0A1E3HD20_9TREE|nr:alpha-1,2-mannosyltransferase [Cryptococcus depauperatus CBS 7841]
MSMRSQELFALGILFSYFLFIFLAFALVFRSILADSNVSNLLKGKAFWFLRSSIGALLCTWYYMFQFMRWSYTDYLAYHPGGTFGQWLVKTALFEQAWSIVCDGVGNWWWSSWICTWTVIFTVLVWSESGKRGIKYPYAYMLLGQLVAISVATGLFLSAVYLHPRTRSRPQRAPLVIALPLVIAFVPIHLLPLHVGSEKFMSSLLWLHGALFLPLLSSSTTEEEGSLGWGISVNALYALLGGLMTGIHVPATRQVLSSISSSKSTATYLYETLLSHPAQSSISMDVIWVGLIVISWFVMSGSLLFKVLKGSLILAVATIVTARAAGVNWGLVFSIIPIFLLLAIGALALYINHLRKINILRRKTLLSMYGLPDGELIQGTDSHPPTVSSRKTVVGFWHPYCNAGGGGERVLWAGVRYIQRTEKDTLVLVYSGDHPTASKEEIIAKVKDRFSIILDPNRLHFVPLPSRYLISDGYWRKFSLLGQSFGSIYLAWQGLCGKDGLWGDIFIDSMGYAFIFPVVRFIAGNNIALGSYTHYPTVSTDMVKRVRKRIEGVESGGASKSWLRTQIKLIYYHVFTLFYSVSLLYIQHIMTNSSWTQAHVQSLLTLARSSLLASILLKDDLSISKREERHESSTRDRTKCEVVYPPCDTAEFVKLGNLDKRKREVVSLAQFRPEKDHAKQIHALAELFDEHTEYRKGPRAVKLVLMGGVRDAADQARLEGLKDLAKKLDVEHNVEFVVSAPFSEVVKRLGEASVGLNTMMDEHFGINVVEFMAAGLIPIVHASAGPLLDIVVPYKGQKTGFHATTSSSFAAALHSAFNLNPDESLKMRKAARQLAAEKFSEQEFENGWARGWERLKGLNRRPIT